MEILTHAFAFFAGALAGSVAISIAVANKQSEVEKIFENRHVMNHMVVRFDEEGKQRTQLKRKYGQAWAIAQQLPGQVQIWEVSKQKVYSRNDDAS